jgi:hypothetical protein
MIKNKNKNKNKKLFGKISAFVSITNANNIYYYVYFILQNNKLFVI